jgi:hypothetical protein
MSRPRGGYIGFNRVPAASGINSAASGIWTLREAEALKRAGTWPLPLPSISGLVLHLSASDAVVSGSNVTSWPARVGNFTLSVGNGQPTYNATGFNGLPQVQFDGVDDALRTTENVLSLGLSDSMSMFAVVRPASLPGTSKLSRRYLVLGGETQDQLGHFLALRIFSAGQNWQAAMDKAGIAGAGADSETTVTVERKLHGMTYNGSTIVNYLNNSQIATGGVAGISGATTGSGSLTIGNQFYASNYVDFYAHVDIAEVLIYSRVLTSDERTLLYTYLNSLYSFE